MTPAVHRRMRRHGPVYVLVLASVMMLVLAQVPIENEEYDERGPRAATTESAADNDTGTPSWWRAGYEGDGTTHEQVGQLHWPPVMYTRYEGRPNYSRDLTSPTKSVNFIYNFTHNLFELVFTDDPALPQKYIMAMGNDVVALGPKVERNDWSDLLARYWLLLFFVIFLVAGIILIPCIGVCYCCLCCCRRCKQGCPTCTSAVDFRRRMCCGTCLAILVVGLCFGVYIAFVSNKFLDRGFDDTTMTMRRGSKDTCVFLKDVADHITHIYVKNFMELETHVIDVLENADKHIFLDLADTSDSNALVELERILDNIPEALIIMREVDKMEKELRFCGSTYRDCLRGMKRDLDYAASVLCTRRDMFLFHRYKDIVNLGHRRCLYYDQLPNTTLYVEAMEKIIKEKYFEIPKRGIARLKLVSDKIRKQMELIIPPFMRDIGKGRGLVFKYASTIRNLIEAVISDIHLNTMRTTKTYDDVYEKFGQDRDDIYEFTCVLIFILIIVLISALLCGCIGPSRTTAGAFGFCSKGTGASCLLMAMIIIFCIYSWVTLIGLFYFLIGLVTYEGACSPSSEGDKNTLFRNLDALIDLSTLSTLADDAFVPPMRMSSAIKHCQANESIFHLLRVNNLFDVDELTGLQISLDDAKDTKQFTEDLSQIYLLTDEEKTLLRELRDGNLSTYHSAHYLSHLCKHFMYFHIVPYMTQPLRKMAEEVLDSKLNYWTYHGGAPPDYYSWSTYHYYYWNAHVALHNARIDGETFYHTFESRCGVLVTKIKNMVPKVDKLILYENLEFGDSIDTLLSAILRAQKFIQERGRDYINNLAQNLTDAINGQLREYIDMLIYESNTHVGHCQPLAYIYYRGVSFICERLVNPLNSAWVGMLLCSLLFLPILFICHRLMCLYLKIYPTASVEDGGHKCPNCATVQRAYTPRPPGTDFPVGFPHPPRHLERQQAALAELQIEKSKRKRE
ncbi:prominin-like protein [Drosophila obscura]|uniref:prominin-like protein n=1 Tax=Drosophila obscura TaxID=7282 RepID=UPI001BB20138|nr:prominin-like protein [Drosophila obscura]